MSLMQHFDEFKTLMGVPQKVVITTHHKPDADALGSSLSMKAYLEKKGHTVYVIAPTDYPRFLHWMKGNDDVIIYNESEEAQQQAAKHVAEADLIFCLDFSSLDRINELGELVREAKGTKILIDHHLEPEAFAHFNMWNIKASATAELVYDLIQDMGDDRLIDVPTGECIYAGIMTDTGSFRHPVTSPKVHRIIASLLERGVDGSKIHRLIYDHNSESRLRFLGYSLLQKLTVLPEYKTAYIALDANELKEYDVKTGDTEGLVNYVLSIEGIVMGVVIIEREDGVKLSLRSIGDFSVNELAKKHFEGGGHKNAAGGLSQMSVEKTVEKFRHILPAYKEALDKEHQSEKLMLC